MSVHRHSFSKKAKASTKAITVRNQTPRKVRKMGIKGKNDKMVVLACEDCKERMELSKYCPTCKKHTNHKETK